MSTQDRLKELARIKKESDEQKKKEWDTYLVRVEESKIAKQQKKQADSIEKSKYTRFVVIFMYNSIQSISKIPAVRISKFIFYKRLINFELYVFI